MPTPTTAADVLRAAADYLDAHPDKWSRRGEWIDSDGCRCAGGVISLVVTGDDSDDGDPFLHRPAAAAVQLFEDHVYDEVLDRFSPDGISGPVIGMWNDKLATGPAHVAATLRAAAGRAA